MKCFCCPVLHKMDIFTLKELQDYITKHTLTVPPNSHTLTKVLDFVNAHNIYVYYDIQLQNTFNLRLSRFKKKV